MYLICVFPFVPHDVVCVSSPHHRNQSVQSRHSVLVEFQVVVSQSSLFFALINVPRIPAEIKARLLLELIPSARLCPHLGPPNTLPTYPLTDIQGSWEYTCLLWPGENIFLQGQVIQTTVVHGSRLIHWVRLCCIWGWKVEDKLTWAPRAEHKAFHTCDACWTVTNQWFVVLSNWG